MRNKNWISDAAKEEFKALLVDKEFKKKKDFLISDGWTYYGITDIYVPEEFGIFGRKIKR